MIGRLDSFFLSQVFPVWFFHTVPNGLFQQHFEHFASLLANNLSKQGSLVGPFLILVSLSKCALNSLYNC